MIDLQLAAASVLIPIVLIIARALYLIVVICTKECRLEKQDSCRTLLCIGSGGHTTEILRLAKFLDFSKYNPRLYVAANTDIGSETKIHTLEKTLCDGSYSVSKIPRSRQVNQSYLSSVRSTLNAVLYTIPVVYNFKPDLILCNGPGTCVPICIVAFVLRCLMLLDCRIVFIESICRVRTLSLTGKILQFIADIVIVQWPQLRDVCFRAKYFGRLT